MSARFARTALAVLAFSYASSVSATSKFCKPAEPPEKAQLDYQVKPSMVVHDDATMSMTFADAGLQNETGGPQDEPLFSFSRTIDSVLRSSGAINANTPAAERQTKRAAFLQTMLSTLRDNNVFLNPKSGVLIPVDDRTSAEGALSPERLLDFKDPEFGLMPRALFNRFDLAPENWQHCGEHRAVYTTKPTNSGDNKRLFIIFEAAVPNPFFVADNLEQSEAGCRGIAEFWAGLPAGGDPESVKERAKRLSAFYYDGIAGVTTAGEAAANPVLSFRNLGGDAHRGQVRGNLFFGGPWQLREWLTMRTTSGLAFVPETVKDNPTVELYTDEPSATTFGQVNIPAVLLTHHAEFVAHFLTTVQNNLMTERSPKYQGLVRSLDSIDAGKVSEDDILVSVVALGADDKFNEFQSVSHPRDTDSATDSAEGGKLKQSLELLNLRADSLNPAQDVGLRSQSADVILARAEAGTCSGCHQTAPRDGVTLNPAIVKVKSDGSTVLWPDVVPADGGFVHVHENGQLSPALENHFLPVRRLIMGTHLCKTLPAIPAAIMAAAPSAAASGYYTDEIVATFSGAAPGGATLLSATGSEAAFEALPLDKKEAAAAAIEAAVRQNREVERRQPGAFFEVRRPH